ncbi:Uncharacterised protein [Bordetella pertussis]|nr:Uncharacterised protein [Bordetella pertussis]CPJ30853.1 Uncharacterised protein [Bordetella pertussis]CPK37461.1 Uncharacterised protein [Bordetella pertussis]CPL66344.1 Uncharacterised protein [Bordetella pertussis]
MRVSLSISLRMSWMARSSTSSRLSKTNISSMIFWARSESRSRRLSTTASSCDEFIMFRISAAVRTPPILLRLAPWPASTEFSTSVSSERAAGCTPPKVAMRSITSLRMRSLSMASTLAARSRSRCTRMVAMICGCSSPISSATVCGSSQFSASMPLPPSPASRMSSIRPAARSLPSALVSTVRM